MNEITWLHCTAHTNAQKLTSEILRLTGEKNSGPVAFVLTSVVFAFCFSAVAGSEADDARKRLAEFWPTHLLSEPSSIGVDTFSFDAARDRI